MEVTEERTEKQPRMETDTDPESTHSRQKKGKMKSIFLSDSDEEGIMDFIKQHEELRLIISNFLGARQDTTSNPRQSFRNYLYSKIEHLEERDFLTFRNETIKLLCGIQYKAEQRKRQVTTSPQVTTFQLPEATQATAGREYILTIPDTQQVSTPAVQPTQMAEPQQPTVIAKVLVQPPQMSASASSQPVSCHCCG